MRITFVLPGLTLNGGVRVVATYAELLKRGGHQVTVVAPAPHLPLKSKLKSFAFGRGWPVLRLEDSYFVGTGIDLKVLDRQREVIESDVPNADVIVATYYTTAHWVRRLPAEKGAKAILIQNYETESDKPNPMLDASWRMPMHKIVISKWLLELAQEQFGDSVVSQVPYGIDFELFSAPARQKQAVPTIGMLYSKSWFKGCRTSLSALEQVAAKLPSLRLISFGTERPGPVALRLPPYAEFHFRPAQNMLKQLYAQCDVWLCASNREGFHMPPMEAMACRCPVVSTRVGGPIDMIESGVNGYLAEIGDANALARGLLKILNSSQEQWKRMSDAAYTTARQYHWEDATMLFEKALELAIERSRRGELVEIQ